MRATALLVLLAAATAHAQPVPFQSIWSDSSAVVVTYSPDSVWLLVVTPWKSYLAHADSTSVASWAARAVTTAGGELTDTSGMRCTLRLAQQSGDANGSYVLTASAPGSSTSIIFPPYAANHLIAALSGPKYERTLILPASDSVIHRLAKEIDTSPPPAVDSGHPYLVQHLPQPLPGNRVPEYPPTLLRHRIAGVVTAQFLVDTMGRPVMSTVRMLKSPHPLMSFAVFQTLALNRFTSGTLGDRKVPTFVQQPITFSVR